MNTLSIKITILSCLTEMDISEDRLMDKAQELYDWIMLEAEPVTSNVTKLEPVQ